MRNVFHLLSMLYFLTSCNQPTSKENESKTQDTSMAITNTQTENNSAIEKDTSYINIATSLYPGSDTVIAKMHIDGFKEQPILTLSITSGKMLYAVISDKPKANLRINQIEMPDSTLDGPFGKSLSYKIKKPGTYQLIIGESMMAEGQYSGDFEIKAWVK